MTSLPPVEVTVYPYECDAYGHLNEAAWLLLFERARWESLARGPGAGFFARHGVWPAVRRAVVEYHRPAFPGDVLAIDLRLEESGRTSLTLTQHAVRRPDGTLLAEVRLVFVMIDGEGRAVRVPEVVTAVFGGRGLGLRGGVSAIDVGGATLAADLRGDGPALLFVHGFPLDRTLWAHQVAALTGWRRIAPDLRGLGLSDVPAEGYSMAAYADDLAGLLDRLGERQAVIAGLSMGGYVAFEMLRRHRDRVAGLILMDTRAEADTPDAKAARDQMIALAKEDGVRAVAERMLPRLLGRSTQQTQPRLVEQVREMMVQAPLAGVVGAVAAMRDREDATPLLAGIGVPTLVVVGQEDEMTPPAAARAMTAAIPSAAMTVIPGAGHLAPLEEPTAVTRVCAEFLEAMRERVV